MLALLTFYWWVSEISHSAIGIGQHPTDYGATMPIKNQHLVPLLHLIRSRAADRKVLFINRKLPRPIAAQQTPKPGPQRMSSAPRVVAARMKERA